MKLAIYKFLSIVLAVVLLVGGSFFLYERHSHAKTKKVLYNQIAKLEKVVKETETAYSKMAVKSEDLESENTELQRIVEKRGERVVALNKISLRWKKRFFRIKKAKQSIQDSDGNEVQIEPGCEECFLGKRFRVDFDHTQDSLRVVGYTLTNPPFAELSLDWIKSIELEVVLTKNKDGNWRVYVDNNNAGLDMSDLKLKVDPSIFDKKWYEKIGIGADIGVGDKIQTTLRAFYDITSGWYVGPLVTFQYDGYRVRKLYGVTVGFYPFRSR